MAKKKVKKKVKKAKPVKVVNPVLCDCCKEEIQSTSVSTKSPDLKPIIFCSCKCYHKFHKDNYKREVLKADKKKPKSEQRFKWVLK